jgi:hypothetical protein
LQRIIRTLVSLVPWIIKKKRSRGQEIRFRIEGTNKKRKAWCSALPLCRYSSGMRMSDRCRHAWRGPSPPERTSASRTPGGADLGSPSDLHSPFPTKTKSERSLPKENSWLRPLPSFLSMYLCRHARKFLWGQSPIQNPSPQARVLGVH